MIQCSDDPSLVWQHIANVNEFFSTYQKVNKFSKMNLMLDSCSQDDALAHRLSERSETSEPAQHDPKKDAEEQKFLNQVYDYVKDAKDQYGATVSEFAMPLLCYAASVGTKIAVDEFTAHKPDDSFKAKLCKNVLKASGIPEAVQAKLKQHIDGGREKLIPALSSGEAEDLHQCEVKTSELDQKFKEMTEKGQVFSRNQKVIVNMKVCGLLSL
jgi:hypothetical protein